MPESSKRPKHAATTEAAIGEEGRRVTTSVNESCMPIARAQGRQRRPPSWHPAAIEAAEVAAAEVAAAEAVEGGNIREVHLVAAVQTRVAVSDLSEGRELRPLPLLLGSLQDSPVGESGAADAINAIPGLRWTYVMRGLNRTVLTPEGAMLPELLERGLEGGLLPRQLVGPILYLT